MQEGKVPLHTHFRQVGVRARPRPEPLQAEIWHRKIGPEHNERRHRAESLGPAGAPAVVLAPLRQGMPRLPGIQFPGSCQAPPSVLKIAGRTMPEYGGACFSSGRELRDGAWQTV